MPVLLESSSALSNGRSRQKAKSTSSPLESDFSSNGMEAKVALSRPDNRKSKNSPIRTSSVDEKRNRLVARAGRVLFDFLPPQTSWLNEIELWFSVLCPYGTIS